MCVLALLELRAKVEKEKKCLRISFPGSSRTPAGTWSAAHPPAPPTDPPPPPPPPLMQPT